MPYFESTAIGNILKSDPPIPGDWVHVELEKGPIITNIVERKNTIFRFQARERKKKLIASNVDIIALVFSVNQPEYKTGILDRYLIRCAQWEIPAICIFTKTDLPHDKSINFNKECSRVSTLVQSFYAISSLNPHAASTIESAKNFEELKKELQDKTILFMGQSGAGKTKLLSSLAEGKLNLVSNDLTKSGKGSHTTTWAELIILPQFRVMDSPGIRSFSLSDLNSEDIIYYFPDLIDIASKCRFHNCPHNPDSKGCLLANEINNKTNLNELVCSRIESFWKIRSELNEEVKR